MSNRRIIVTREVEPTFDIGRGYMPVSRDIPEADREVIIRDLKRVDTAETVTSICLFGFFGLVVVFLISLVLSVTVVLLNKGV